MPILELQPEPTLVDQPVVASALLGDPIGTVNESGTMGMIARRVADAGINVCVLYVATNNRAVVLTDDNARAMELMG